WGRKLPWTRRPTLRLVTFAYRKFWADADSSRFQFVFFMDTLTSIRDTIVRGETTARAVVTSALDAAEKLNDTLNAFLEIDREGALRRAGQIDALDQSEKARISLAGVPVAIKDNICVRGMQTSCGSRILGPYQPPYNATAIERLLDAGV